MLLGGSFLDYDTLSPGDPAAGQHLGILLVETAIGITVAAVMTTIFFSFASRGSGAMIATHYVYWLLFALMMIGLYVVISHGNLLKKLIGLSRVPGRCLPVLHQPRQGRRRQRADHLRRRRDLLPSAAAGADPDRDRGRCRHPRGGPGPRRPHLRGVRHGRGGQVLERDAAERSTRTSARDGLMTAQLPALQVVIPLVCAPLCVLLRSRTAAWLLFLFAALGSLACAVAAGRAGGADGRRLRYAMGGWPAPAGIEFVVGGFNTPVLLLVSLIAVVVAVYSRRSVAAEIDDQAHPAALRLPVPDPGRAAGPRHHR